MFRYTEKMRWVALAVLLVGQFLTAVDMFSWKAVLFVNAPIALVALVSGLLILPEFKLPTFAPWNIADAFLSLLGMVLLLWGIKHLASELVPIELWGDAAIVSGMAILGVFLWRCSHTSNPLVDIRLFQHLTFVAGVISVMTAMFAMAIMLLFVAQWLQLSCGLDSLTSGICLVPMAIASSLASLMAPKLTDWFGAQNVICVSLGIAGIGMMLPFLVSTSDLFVVIAATVGVGIGGAGITMGSALILQQASLSQASSAVSFSEVSFDLGNVLGVAIIGSIAAIFFRSSMNPSLWATAGFDPAQVEAAISTGANAISLAHSIDSDSLLEAATSAFNRSIFLASAVGGLVALALVVV